MKIMFVTHNMAGGGCERVIARLLTNFASRGDTLWLVTECAGDSFYPLPDAVKRFALTDKTRMSARDIPRAYLALVRLVRREKPELVLAMPEKVNVWTVLFLMGTGVPVAVSERNDPLRHPESRVKRALRRLVYPFAAGFIFQTQQAADCFPRGIRARGVILDNPLDTGRLPAPQTGGRGKTVVGAGRLEPQKNFSLLIRAFAAFFTAHPDWRLVIYGEGSERAALEALCQELLPGDAWSLPGQTDRLYDELLGAGMFVMSSDFEGMPNALIEAMALGAPAISTDCRAGGPASLICDGQNGLLTPVGNSAAMADAMGRIASDKALAEALSAEAVKLRVRLDEAAVTQKWRDYLAALER